MRAVVQRVHGASCVVEGKTVAAIGAGLVAYVGVFDDDTEEDAERLAKKIARLRVFCDESGRLAKDCTDAGGSVMVISNFVLAGRTSRGYRPDCTHAAGYDEGKRLYELVISRISESLPSVHGFFGAHMEICVHNDGPINVIIDTRESRGK